MRFVCYVFVIIALMKIPFGNCLTTKRIEYTDMYEFLKKFQSTNGTTATPVDPTPKLVKSFCKSVKKRLDLDVDLARYKWKHGMEIKIQKEDYVTMIERFENKARELQIPVAEAAQFMADLIEAGSTIQYALVSDWYAEMEEIDRLPPVGRKVGIDSIYYEMSQHEDIILNNMAALSEYKLDRSCNTEIAKTLLDINYDRCTLKRIALQMTMCNFCRFFMPHEYPFKGSKGRAKHTFKKPRYRRKPTVSTTSPESTSEKSRSIIYDYVSSFGSGTSSSSDSSKSSKSSKASS